MTRKIEATKILSSTSTNGLDDKLEPWVNDGWQPFGGVSSTAFSNHHGEMVAVFTILVVMYEDET